MQIATTPQWQIVADNDFGIGGKQATGHCGPSACPANTARTRLLNMALHVTVTLRDEVIRRQ